MEREYAVVFKLNGERIVKTVYAIGETRAKEKATATLLTDIQDYNESYTAEDVINASVSSYAYLT